MGLLNGAKHFVANDKALEKIENCLKNNFPNLPQNKIDKVAGQVMDILYKFYEEKLKADK